MLVVDSTGFVSLSETPIGADLSGKVDKAQGPDNAGRGLMVDETGTVGLTPDSFGQLAYKGMVSTDDITDGSVTRQKAAADIVGTLNWVDWWNTNKPAENALLSFDADGNQQWYIVVDE